ncbi:uncharacterized protein LOC106670859 isoform X1 [Cimex lectularius]|uniref:RUN domain-containing protein n=2 Tax=Cimex lectularius TaxID=79782 RepID=A0A8I6S2K4_CIMLE|nr:uncharacterized protein LOC106670859 isoform X1 [Cimex lectularius]
MKRPEIDIIDTDCLLKNLKNGMELVVSTEEKGVGLASLVVRSVAEILKHGLREPKVSFWHIVRDLTHSSTRQCLARSLKHIHDNQQRGLFWIYYTLIEGSLDSYMHCLVSDGECLNRNYLDYALLRDNFCVTKFILLLTSLAQVNITPLDSTTCVGLRLEFHKNSKETIVSTPSSTISSPGDSGLHESMDDTSDGVFDLNKKLCSSDSTLTQVEAAFSDCSLSCATEPLAKAVQRRKRVSFHETVMGEDSKGTIWERRSCDVETMAWWKAGLITAGEKGEDALNMERGAPEGSEDPQAFVEMKSERQVKPLKRTMKRRKPFGRSRNIHFMAVYPGAVEIEMPDHIDDTELHAERIATRLPERMSSLERFLNTSIYKMYNMIDNESNSYVCFLAMHELCFITLTDNRVMNMHRILYKDMEYVGVGPSPEHLTLQDGKRFLITTRGEDFCSWLHYAVYKETAKVLDFIRITPEDAFTRVLSNYAELKCLNIIYTTWAVICDPFCNDDRTYSQYLMISVGMSGNFWEPAMVEINSRCELELRPCAKGRKNLRLPLSECTVCDRCISSERPYTFKLRFDRKSPRDRLIVFFAAPDSDSMSSWMQAILVAVASKKNEKDIAPVDSDRGHYLIATDGTLALINSTKDRLVSRVFMKDVCTLFTGHAYLVLELDCHEVEDKANDWILYFYSDEIKSNFLNFMTQTKPELVKTIYKHKEVSCNWSQCADEQESLDRPFQNIITYLTSL